MFKYPYVICVSDGHVMRALHRPNFSQADASVLDGIIERALLPPEIDRSLPIKEKVEILSPPTKEQMRVIATGMARKRAREQGYDGNACDTCGQFKMKRSGTCLVCESCGATTGCS